MGILDIIFIIIFIAAIVYGYKRGFFAQMGAVGGILLAIIACRLFAPWVSSKIAPSGADANEFYVSSILANVLVFIVIYLIARVIFSFFKGVTHALKLGIIDRLAGVVFAIFEWFFIASLALNIWQIFEPGADISRHSKLDHGRVLAAVRDFAPTVLGSDTARDIFNAIP